MEQQSNNHLLISNQRTSDTNKKVFLILTTCAVFAWILFLNSQEMNDHLPFLRLLSDNTLDSSIETTEPNDTANITKDIHPLEYEFVNNITLLDYMGTWNGVKFNQTIINTDTGVANLGFFKGKNNYFIIDSEEKNKMKAIIILKEGKYIDHYLQLYFNITFPNNMTAIIQELFQPNSSVNELVFKNNNISLDLYVHDFMIQYTVYHLNKTNITLTLVKNPKVLRDSFKEMFLSIFSTANVKIEGNFSADITTDVFFSKNEYTQVSNYTCILTLLSFMDIYLIFKLLIEVTENNQIGKNLDMISLVVSIIYKSVICTSHFYISLTVSNDDLSYQYGIPSLLYFFAFSIFEMRLLFFTWKANQATLFNNDIRLFKRKLFFFYFLFYILLLCSIISIRLIFTNYFLTTLFFSSTWIFQIIHSLYTNTRPPMSYTYIIAMTLEKLFLPIYLKANNNNLFNLRPAYWKVGSIVLILLIQMVILILQKAYGTKVIIPRIWRSKSYDYYKDNVIIDDHISKNQDCVICLDSLTNNVGLEINTDQEILNQPQNHKALSFYVEKINKFFISLSSRHKKRKFMITPCDHVFHSNCLEKWIEIRNECPYCKTEIPSLD